MLIYWKAIQFGILEALSYVTIKRKFQTYFPCLYDVVVMYLGDYLRWWSLKIVEYWNSVFIQSWRKEKLGYEYTTSYEDMKKFKCRFWSLSLPTFKIARGQNLFAVQTFQKKDSLEFFQWQTILVKKNESFDKCQDVKRNKSSPGSGRAADPHLTISIALSLCLSVSCSAHTFVSKLKLQGEKRRRRRKQREIK